MGLLRWALSLLFWLSSVAFAQHSPAPERYPPSQDPPDQKHPALSHRSPLPPGAREGQIQMDVLVTDAAGRPVAGLERGDFTLLDDKKPQPIRFFRAFDGSNGQGADEPPAEVILLIDATNNSLHNIAFERDQIEKFLRQNGGHLAQPLTLMIFSERGVQVGPQPSVDGNLVAQELDKSGATMHTVQRSGGYDAIERLDCR
jgi:VWFA-related protein